MLYELPENTIEIVFLGSSHSHRTHIPIVYNDLLKVDTISMGVNGLTIEHLYYQLVEILKTQNPKIVVMEFFSLYQYNKFDWWTTHKSYDSMNVSMNKFKAINSSVPIELRMEFFIPIISYHQNWKTFLEVFNDVDDNPFYGFIPSYTKVKYHTTNDIVDQKNFSNDELYISESYLNYVERILQLCDENNISIILNISPYIEQYGLTVYDAQKYINGLHDYFGENDIDVIDFSYNPSNYDIYMDDLHDDGHLNVGGAYKASMALGEIMAQEYLDILANSRYDFEMETNQKLEAFEFVLDKFYRNKEILLNSEE